jgi:hypothetical protein
MLASELLIAVQRTGSQAAVGVADLARAFFSCPVFRRLELPLLQRFYPQGDSVSILQYNSFRLGSILTSLQCSGSAHIDYFLASRIR